MYKNIILDRDGVINIDSKHYIKSPQEWHPIPNSMTAISKLTQRGFNIYVATNQSGLARGLFDKPTLEAIFDKMNSFITSAGGKLTGIVYCPHHPDDNCDCRKPKPGLLYQLQQQYKIDFKGSVLIGDSLRDIQAAQAVAMPSILVKTGKGQQTLHDNPELSQTVPVFDSLFFASEYILDKST